MGRFDCEYSETEWGAVEQFDSPDEALEIGVINAIVCGDELRLNETEHRVEIYNHHAQEIRWAGKW